MISYNQISSLKHIWGTGASPCLSPYTSTALKAFAVGLTSSALNLLHRAFVGYGGAKSPPVE